MRGVLSGGSCDFNGSSYTPCIPSFKVGISAPFAFFVLETWIVLIFSLLRITWSLSILLKGLNFTCLIFYNVYVSYPFYVCFVVMVFEFTNGFSSRATVFFSIPYLFELLRFHLQSPYFLISLLVLLSFMFINWCVILWFSHIYKISKFPVFFFLLLFLNTVCCLPGGK